MKHSFTIVLTAALLAGAASIFPTSAHAGSCCGGGQAAALILPKFAQSMVDFSADWEKYDGFWGLKGKYNHDEPSTDLNQYRLNLGYALRLVPRWQVSAAVPYVWNVNKHQNGTSRVNSLGDTVFSLWYEAFNTPMCRLGWSSLSLSDLVPAATFGLSLTVPTGVSPYDGVKADDITGRGFYRLDGNLLLDKTIYPLSMSLFLGYGKHLERPVNREVEYVPPYRKNLGDRAAGTLAISYVTLFDAFSSRHRLTYTAAFSEVWEDKDTMNGARVPTSGFQKSSVAGTLTYSTFDRLWSVRLTWNYSIKKDDWGSNFPASDIYTIGVNRAFE
jgi:hypothetical protein